MDILTRLQSTLDRTYAGQPPSRIVLQAVGGTVTLLFLGYAAANASELKEKIMAGIFSGLKAIPLVQGEVQKEKDKLKKTLAKTFAVPQEEVVIIPSVGMNHEEILRRLDQLQKLDETHWRSGKVSGVVYSGSDDHCNLLNQAYAMFSLSNPLHPDVFPSVRKFEAEIIKMTAEMMYGTKAVGAVTSGGTESILMAVKAYRDTANKANPEIIVPITAHAAFDKAGQYFRIKVVHVPVDNDGRAIVSAVEKAINKNTIMIAGSAPQFPHGAVDPIPEMSALAKKHNIGFHTDACLGGYLLPWVQRAGLDGGKLPVFDFRLEGVTSMSVDTHKYGYTTKGTSVVLYASEELRRGMYFVQPNWPGGMYASTTMAGSRAGGIIACCWASLVAVGKEGFMEKSAAIYKTAQNIKEGVKKISSLELVGDSYSSVIAFKSKSSSLDIFKVTDAMNSKGWNLNNLQKPSCVHICVTLKTVGMDETFLTDLVESVKLVEANPKAFPDGQAPMYGMAASFPDRTVVSDIAATYLDAMLDS